MEGKTRKRLLEILEECFDELELRKVAYFVMEKSGAYDDLRGKSKPEKALSLLEWLEFRGLFDKLLGYIEEFRTDIDLTGIIPKSLPPEIQFSNREDEVSRIVPSYSPPYVLISAPLGYGKTKLLEIVRGKMQSQGWFCVNCTLPKGGVHLLKDLIGIILQPLGIGAREMDFESLSPKEYGFLLSQSLVTRLNSVKASGVLLLLDQVEALKEDVAKLFLNDVIPGLSQGLRSAGYIQLKIILSGCYVSNWEQLAQKIPLSLRLLEPFDFPVVQHTVLRFMSDTKTPPPLESIQEIAAHIMYLTGGHPGCMVELLKGFPAGWPAREYFIDRQGQHYENIIAPVINDARRHIPETLHDIFDTLSVVRYFNNRFLRRLMDARLIRWSRTEFDLEDELTRTHMVTRTHGFLHDAITQRLLSIRLRRLDMDLFMKICEESIAFYDDSLQDLGANRPDILCIELLFQKVQYLYYKKLGGKDALLAMVPDVMKKLTAGRNAREMVLSCMDLLKKDWELRFIFNYLFQKDIYDHNSPYNELVESIASFLPEEGGQP
ncbi:MAG: hypothetical protein JXA21_15425 [Anaerolineae bacterium]|nr:hypothetical protein [Anaerolineae bacterium]